MSSSQVSPCCPPFNPAPWENQEIHWDNKLFIQDRVRSFFHIPLNFPAVMKRNMAKIETAGAFSENMIVLADENSLWGADVYIEVTKEVPNAKLAKLSGTFVSRVFEGPFRDIGKWVKTMQGYVREKGLDMRKLLFYYTTCPRCAKHYGKNYVVLLAQVPEL